MKFHIGDRICIVSPGKWYVTSIDTIPCHTELEIKSFNGEVYTVVAGPSTYYLCIDENIMLYDVYRSPLYRSLNE